MVMLLTLMGASQTHFTAKTAKMFGHLAVASHGIGCQGTDCRAVSIQGDASRHHLNIRLLETLSKTCVACDSTGVACVNAVLILICGIHR